MTLTIMENYLEDMKTNFVQIFIQFCVVYTIEHLEGKFLSVEEETLFICSQRRKLRAWEKCYYLIDLLIPDVS